MPCGDGEAIDNDAPLGCCLLLLLRRPIFTVVAVFLVNELIIQR